MSPRFFAAAVLPPSAFLIPPHKSLCRKTILQNYDILSHFPESGSILPLNHLDSSFETVHIRSYSPHNQSRYEYTVWQHMVPFFGAGTNPSPAYQSFHRAIFCRRFPALTFSNLPGGQ